MFYASKTCNRQEGTSVYKVPSEIIRAHQIRLKPWKTDIQVVDKSKFVQQIWATMQFHSVQSAVILYKLVVTDDVQSRRDTK